MSLHPPIPLDLPISASRGPVSGSRHALLGAVALLAIACAPLPALGQAAGPQAAPTAAPAPVTGCDAACVRQNSERASQACAPRIEAQSLSDFEWLTRPFGGLFQEAEPPELGKTVVRYRGDSIRFLGPQREWVRVSYECAFDAATQSIAHVNVRLGRLNMAAQSTAGVVAAPGPTDRVTPPAPPAVRAVAPRTETAPQPVRQAIAPVRKILLVGEPNEVEIRQVNPRAIPQR